MSRGTIVTVGLHNWQSYAPGKHVVIGVAVGAQETATCRLEVSKVVRVIDDAHLIGIAKDDSYVVDHCALSSNAQKHSGGQGESAGFNLGNRGLHLALQRLVG